MAKRNATAAVIGAGDFIGAAIAKKFAAEGFTIFAGRRNAEKLAPLVADIEAAGGEIVARGLDARKEDDIAASSARRRRACAARSLRVQCRRQRQLSAFGNHRAGVPQGLGVGLLCRLSQRTRGGAADAGPRPRLHFLHRRDRERARRHRLCGVRQRQIRPARGGAEHGARAWAEEHPCRASDYRCRRRYRVRARAHQASRPATKALARLDPDQLMHPASVAEAYWQLYRQPRDAWTFELDMRPYRETW